MGSNYRNSAATAPLGANVSVQNRVTVTRLMGMAHPISARRILNIGVFKGQTFLNMSLPHMHTVDPAFWFDVRTEARINRRSFSQTSIQLPTAPPDQLPYDLIYLDGLHTVEQTGRDYCGCLGLTHAGRVIVMADTMPSDLFSMIPDQAAALWLRKQHGLNGVSWHGDVC